MPRLSKNSSSTSASAGVTNRTGRLKFHWSSSDEPDQPANNAAAGGAGLSWRHKHVGDDLGALLDKALAFAG